MIKTRLTWIEGGGILGHISNAQDLFLAFLFALEETVCVARDQTNFALQNMQDKCLTTRQSRQPYDLTFTKINLDLMETGYQGSRVK